MISSEVRLALGEGPLWHPVSGRLYVTDVYSGTLHVFDAGLALLQTIETGRITSAMTACADGSILLFHDQGAISRLAPDGTRVTLIDSLPGEEDGGRFNDVIADGAGRVLCGTEPIGQRPGKLYSIAPDLSWRVLIEAVGEPNGLGFSPDRRLLYFSDSVAQTVWRFPYDEQTGALGTRDVFYRTAQDVVPDGLTVDSEGWVWVALWNGGGMVRISADGTVVSKRNLPALRTTSVTYGGRDNDTLFVTSARGHGATPPAQFDGAVFALPDCGTGRAEFLSRLGE